jgi:hypothetical protein
VVIVGADASALAERMDHLATVGRGWINVMPEIPDDVEVPPTPNALAVFSKRGPMVPLGTWTASNLTRHGAEPSEVGVHHGAAASVRKRLVGTPGEIPSSWQVVQDHPRRGLVARPAAGAATIDIARWLLGVLGELCIPPQTGNFVVFVYDR